MSHQLHVLIVEDNPADAELLVRELRRAQFDPQWQRVETEEDYLANLRPDLDLILSDFEMPEFGGPRGLLWIAKIAQRQVINGAAVFRIEAGKF